MRPNDMLRPYTCIPHTSRFALVIAAAASFGCEKASPKAHASADVVAPHATSISVAPELVTGGRIAIEVASRRVPSPELEAPGEVRSNEGDEALVSSLVAGRVAELKGNVGDRVKRGQALVTVQAPEVARLRADERRADARMELAQRALNRLRELQSEGATSQATLENAQAELQTAKADRDAIRTQLAGLGLRMDGLDGSDGASTVVLRSPIDGVVVERRSLLGASVSPGDFLYRIVAEETRGVLVHLPESHASRVFVGTKVKVRPRENDGNATTGSCDATVERVTGVVDESRTMPVRLLLAPTCKLHGTGRSLTVTIPLDEAQASPPVMMVPAAAVVELRGKSVLFLQTGETPVFTWRAVRVGDHVGAHVIVDDGLSEGERVVVRGTVLLKGEVIRAEPLE